MTTFKNWIGIQNKFTIIISGNNINDEAVTVMYCRGLELNVQPQCFFM